METPKPRPPSRPLTAVPVQRGPLPLSAIPRKKSRCTVPRAEPLTWVYYNGKLGNVVEEIDQTTSLLLPMDRELVLELVDQKGELAALGQLEDESDDMKPVSFDPEMWELRFEHNGVEYRLYFAEPYTHPLHLVALHFHAKSLEGNQQQIDDAQDAEMAKAKLKFKSGEANEWGNAA